MNKIMNKEWITYSEEYTQIKRRKIEQIALVFLSIFEKYLGRISISSFVRSDFVEISPFITLEEKGRNIFIPDFVHESSTKCKNCPNKSPLNTEIKIENMSPKLNESIKYKNSIAIAENIIERRNELNKIPEKE